MAIASWNFLVFGALAGIAWHLARRPPWRAAVLLAANLAFLATVSTQARAFAPFALFLLAGFAALRLQARVRSGRLLGVLVLALTLLFCWLKKYWFLEGLGFLGQAYVTVGLSYVFFRIVHLVIDARDDAQVAAIGPLAYANYALNFTTLIAGPIQRYQDFARPVPPLDLALAGRAVERIVIGFFKVQVVAAVFSALHDHASADLARHAGLADRVEFATIAVGTYPVYLFFNFSGYVDIVIGVARFVGLELPENFNRPFSAPNFIDFWARWHMTLSNWLKDYVYAPFVKAMMRRFPQQEMDLPIGLLAFFLTFFLIGIWHGSTLIFAVYGLMLGAGVSVNKTFQTVMTRRLGRKGYRSLSERPAYRALCRGMSFTWFAVSLVCFWVGGDEARQLLATLGVSGTLAGIAALLALATPVLEAIERLRAGLLAIRAHGESVVHGHVARTVFATAMVFTCLAVALLSETAAPDIVYKAF
jgi:D-alanyl-lipoteichoic acid acyltransferase DltB (MBOAT superfamily)